MLRPKSCLFRSRARTLPGGLTAAPTRCSSKSGCVFPIDPTSRKNGEKLGTRLKLVPFRFVLPTFDFAANVQRISLILPSREGREKAEATSSAWITRDRPALNLCNFGGIYSHIACPDSECSGFLHASGCAGHISSISGRRGIRRSRRRPVGIPGPRTRSRR
jgi:hypothetical protein